MKKTMTILMVLAVICITALSANADVRVRGYYRRNGTYVQPHYRSNPDGNFYNNWSTYPNINPHTGAIGTKRTPSYSGGYSWRTPSYRSSSKLGDYTLTTPYPNFSVRSSSLATPYSSSSTGSSSLWSE